MSIRCPGCDYELPEDALPRLDDVARVLCPQCRKPLTMPEMTIPLSIAQVKVRAADADEGLDPKRKYALLVLSGSESGKVIAIDKKLVTIGRSGCDVVIDDPELSRRHAKIRIHGADATLEDLSSTNGTFVADERIQTAEIENRSKFRVGNVELAFVVTDRID
jgi:S-DNA-T family DNA segregation ATPase FtsK/SpoIIIE